MTDRLRKQIVSGSFILLLGIGIFFAGRSLTVIYLAHAQVVAVPFTLQMDIASPDASGKLEVFKTKLLARRSDGGTVTVESYGPTVLGQTSRKIVLLDGTSAFFLDALRLKSTFPPKSVRAIAAMKASATNPSQDCLSGPRSREVLLRFDTINAEKVAVIQGVTGQFRLTRWAAPRLDCEILYYESEQVQDDGSFALAVRGKLSSLVFAEPDGRLFDMGNEYSEMRPSDIQTKAAENMGIQETLEMRQHALKRDKGYAANPRQR